MTRIERTSLVRQLLTRDEQAFDSTARGLVRSPAHVAEDAIVEALKSAWAVRRWELVILLGDLGRPGPADAEIVRLLRSPESNRHLRAAAVLALARRLRSAGMGHVVHALVDPSHEVRGSAVESLAAFGDEQAWDDVVAWFRNGYRAADAEAGLGYAARCSPQVDAGRRRALAAVVRARRSSLPVAFRSRLESEWPGLLSGDPDEDPGSPDPRGTLAGHDWSTSELFGVFYG